MGETTKIQWTDHTFNPWVGCSKVHAGCANCYAEADMDKRRHFAQWGAAGTRVKTSESNWRKPLKWDREAKAAGVRRRVFCASLADVFEDREELKLWREGLFDLIDETPNLDWLLLTKRPENINRMWPLPHNGRDPSDPLVSRRDNVWLGTSISDQATADKAIPELLKCRDLAPVLFLSAEPLLGKVNLTPYLGGRSYRCSCGFHQTENELIFSGGNRYSCTKCSERCEIGATIGWVILGGESGPQARPCDPEWIRWSRDQCKSAGVACFVKQLGSNIVTRNDMIEDEFNNSESGWPDPEVEHDIHGFREEYQGADCRVKVRDKKGGDPAEWPEDLRVREFPKVTVQQ